MIILHKELGRVLKGCVYYPIGFALSAARFSGGGWGWGCVPARYIKPPMHPGPAAAAIQSRTRQAASIPNCILFIVYTAYSLILCMTLNKISILFNCGNQET